MAAKPSRVANVRFSRSSLRALCARTLRDEEGCALICHGKPVMSWHVMQVAGGLLADASAQGGGVSLASSLSGTIIQ